MSIEFPLVNTSSVLHLSANALTFGHILSHQFPSATSECRAGELYNQKLRPPVVRIRAGEPRQ